MAILINDVEPHVQYTAGAGNTIFTIPFEFFDNADIVATVDGVAQVLVTDYTLAGAGTTGGGTLTFGTPLSGGEVVTIYRDVPVARLTDYQNNGDLRAASFNTDLDRIVAMVQQQERDIGRGIRVTPSDTAATLTLPMVADRANLYLGFDASGNVAAVEGTSGLLKNDLASLDAGKGASLVKLENGRTLQDKSLDLISVKDFGAVGDGVTDDSAAIQLACDAIRDAINNTSVGSYALLFPPGKYYIGTGLDLTNIRVNLVDNQPPPVIYGFGATLLGNCAGKPVIDFTRSRKFVIYGLDIVGDATNTPLCGIQLARGENNQPAGNFRLHLTEARGWFTRSAVYAFASEVLYCEACDFSNNTAGGYVFIMDGVNYYGASSDYYTIANAQYVEQSNIIHTFVGCVFGQGLTGVTRKGIQFIEGSKLELQNCYIVCEGAPGVEIATYTAGARYRCLDLDFHMESSSYNPTYMVEFSSLNGATASAIVQDFKLKENNNHANTAVIGNTTSNPVEIVNGDISIANCRPAPAAQKLFGQTTFEYQGSVYWGDGSVAPTGFNITRFDGDMTLPHAPTSITLPSAGVYKYTDTLNDNTHQFGNKKFPVTTFSPVFSFDTEGDLSVVYTSQGGFLQRVGDLVFFNLYLGFTPTYTTASGNVRIKAFPIASRDDAVSLLGHMAVSVGETNQNLVWPANSKMLTARMREDTTYVELFFSISGGGAIEAGTTEFPSGSAQALRISGVYLAA